MYKESSDWNLSYDSQAKAGRIDYTFFPEDKKILQESFTDFCNELIVNWYQKDTFISPIFSMISDMDPTASASTQTQESIIVRQKTIVKITNILSNLRKDRTKEQNANNRTRSSFNYTHRMIEKSTLKFVCRKRHLIGKHRWKITKFDISCISPKNTHSKK